MLAVAQILTAARHRIRGSVKFIFQPAEEAADDVLGPYGGAHEMISDGVLQGVDQLYGLHLWNYLPCGAVAVQAGPVMAACDTFSITVKGKGGHGSTPHLTVDPIVCGAALVQGIQTIVSRSSDPFETVAVTVGSFNAGEAPNVIAPVARLSGTVRTFSSEAQAVVERRMAELCQGAGQSAGAEVVLQYAKESPAVVNAEGPSGLVAKALQKVSPSGLEPVVAMASEDISFFLNAVPGAFFFIGSAPSGAGGAAAPGHHTESFDIDEESLLIGASAFVQLIDDMMMSDEIN